MNNILEDEHPVLTCNRLCLLQRLDTVCRCGAPARKISKIFNQD